MYQCQIFTLAKKLLLFRQPLYCQRREQLCNRSPALRYWSTITHLTRSIRCPNRMIRMKSLNLQLWGN